MLRKQCDADLERRRARQRAPRHPTGARIACLNRQTRPLFADQAILTPPSFELSGPIHPEPARLVLPGRFGIPHESQELTQLGFLDRPQLHEVSHLEMIFRKRNARGTAGSEAPRASSTV